MSTRVKPRSPPTLNTRLPATNFLSRKCCANNILAISPRASLNDSCADSMDDRITSSSSSCSTTLQVSAPYSSNIDKAVQSLVCTTPSEARPSTLTLQSQNSSARDSSHDALAHDTQESCSFKSDGILITSTSRRPMKLDHPHSNQHGQTTYTNQQISPTQDSQQPQPTSLNQHQNTNGQSQSFSSKALNLTSSLRPPTTPLSISHLVSPVEVPSDVHPIEPSELASMIHTMQSSPSISDTSTSSKSSPPNSQYGPSASSQASSIPAHSGSLLRSLDTRTQPQQGFSRKMLLIDTRLVTLYALGFISTAISVCIPTTLLKRPNFGLQKFGTCLSPQKQTIFKNISDYEYIVLYDQNSTDLTTSNYSALLYTSLKFARSTDVPGKVVFLRGGFEEFSQQYPALVETRDGPNDREPTNSSQLSNNSDSSGHGTASNPEPRGHLRVANSYMEEGISTPLVLSNFSIPLMATKKGPIPAFFSNIRNAMEQPDDAEFPVSLPPDLTELEIQSSFSPWLKVVIDRNTGPKQVTRNFNSLESNEKSRLLDAFSEERMRSDQNCDTHNQGDSTTNGDKVVISGVELGSKNRYNNIWPYAHSRVRLHRNRGGVSDDYINANFIENSSSSHRYIATQGPLPSTFNDFWQMVWTQNVPVIVMLTAESEGGQIKCDKYWRQGWHGDVQVSTVSKCEMPLSSASGSNITVRKFLLRHRDSIVEKSVSHIQYGSWPDFGASASPRDLLALCELKNRLAKEIFLADKNSGNVFECMPPTIVHCSAGCGRTGTFCVVDTIIDLMRNHRWVREVEEDLIYRTVENFRKQRLSMVQSIRQYALCYEAVILWQHLFNRREIA